MGFTSLTVAVPGGEIFATRRGEGEGPPVLLLHGGPGIGAEQLVSLVEELDGLIDGVLPQQRGLEPSTLAGPRDVETHVADAIAVLDHLGWDRAWLIGHAWGAHLGMHIAVAHPERAAGLIALDALGALPPDGGSGALVENLVARLTPDERSGARRPRRAPGRRRRRPDTHGPDVHDPVAVICLRPRQRPAAPDAAPRACRSTTSPTRWRRSGPISRRGPSSAACRRSICPRCSCSARAIRCRRARRSRPRRSSAAPGSQPIEEAAHFPWLERPGVVRAAVEAMLREAG